MTAKAKFFFSSLVVTVLVGLLFFGGVFSGEQESPATPIEKPVIDEYLDIDAELAQIRVEKGKELEERQLFQEALEEYHEARKLNPTRADVYDTLGMVYYRLGEYAVAKTHLEKYIELHTEMTARIVNQVRLFILKFEEEESLEE